MGKKEKGGKGNTESVGAPVIAEVSRIQNHIEQQKPSIYVDLIKKIDVYKELRLRDALPSADIDGFFLIEGEKFGTVEAWTRVLGISSPPIVARIRKSKIKGITGRDPSNVIQKAAFYSEKVIRFICSDLLIQCPKSDKKGFFEKENIRYGTVNAWSEELDITPATIISRIKRNSLCGITGKSRIGKVLDGGFFSEEDIKNSCNDLLVDCLLADNNGFIFFKNERYSTMRGWSKELHLDKKVVGARVIKNSLVGIMGKSKMGKICSYYSESDVRECCRDVFGDYYMANKDNFFLINEVVYRTLDSWSKVLNISWSTLKARSNSKKLIGVTGKSSTGPIVFHGFFSEIDIKKACLDLLKDCPQSAQDDFLYIDGVRFGNIEIFSREYNVKNTTIRSRIEKSGIVGITGKSKQGKIYTNAFYSEKDVAQCCADLIQPDPQSNKDGIIFQDGLKYGTIIFWSNELNISQPTIAAQIKEKKIRGITGKDRAGIRRPFYSEASIRALRPDLLVEMPKADTSGFFVIENERFGLLFTWRRELGIKHFVSTLFSLLEKNKRKGITGKDSSGRVSKNGFYSETDIKIIHSVLFEIPQKKKK